MKEINIREETEKFLVNWFKKFVGKYIYFTYRNKDKGVMSIFFVKEVALRNGNAKVKVSYYDKKEKELSKGRWSLVRTLKDKWFIVNKKELKKLLILENLK